MKIMFPSVATKTFLTAFHARTARGLSLLELLLTVAVLGALATVSAVAVNNVSKKAQARKLESDVTILNSAIRVYVSNGGNLDSANTPAEVLRKLKSSLSKADKKRHVGAPSGKMIDNRVVAVPIPSDSWRSRAIYNSGSQRFEIVSNQAGVEFRLDEAAAEIAPDLESRDSTVSYAETSGWVWDHASTANPSGPGGPSTFGTNPDIEDSIAGEEQESEDSEPTGGGGGSAEPPAPKSPRLPRPTLSKYGGSHPEDEFPLTITVLNLPDPEIGEPFYRIDSGSWTPYSSPIDVPMNTALRVKFVSMDSENWRDSPQRYAYYYPVPDSLSGTTDGNFHSPRGGPNLVWEITNSNDHFSHGDPVYILDGEPVDSGSPNVLQFDAKAFTNIAPGEKFKLGEFFYHNGNSYYDSHAIKVGLKILINLPERGQNIDFDLNLDLVNTTNDPDDPAASADYVKIQNLNQNISLQINGVSYRMVLEFGATDSFGFATKNSFHVYEGATGKGDLIATFLPK